MSKKDEFIAYAESQCGKKGDKFWRSVGSAKNMPWSTTFITSCAKQTGICNKVLPNTSNANSYIKKGRNDVSSPGKFLPNNNLPQSGDIVMMGTDENNIDRVGIVRSYDLNTGTMKVIMGDSTKSGHNRSIVSMFSYDPTYNEIVGYFRPDWDGIE